MVNHSTEQQYDLLGKPKSISILFNTSWRSSQNPHVPFELEQFQFFPLTVGSKVHQTERFFQSVEGKRKKALSDLVTFSLSLPFLFLSLYYLCVLLFCLSQSSLFFALFNMFLFSYFQFCFIFFFKIFFFEKIEKYKNNVCLYTLVLVYLGCLLKQSFLNFVSFVT